MTSKQYEYIKSRLVDPVWAEQYKAKRRKDQRASYERKQQMKALKAQLRPVEPGKLVAPPVIYLPIAPPKAPEWPWAGKSPDDLLKSGDLKLGQVQPPKSPEWKEMSRGIVRELSWDTFDLD